jgi:hypothetical protein
MSKRDVAWYSGDLNATIATAAEIAAMVIPITTGQYVRIARRYGASAPSDRSLA